MAILANDPISISRRTLGSGKMPMPASISKPYQRYLLSAVREHMHFEEVPIKLYLRRRQASDTRDDTGADEIGPIVDLGEDQPIHVE